MPVTDIQRLVPHPRETYLRQNEARIRSEALVVKTDPAVLLHLSGIEFAEDLQDYHESVISHFRDKGLQHRIPPHERYQAQAFQLKLHHLDKLAHLTV
jgi:hypothetical protein